MQRKSLRHCWALIGETDPVVVRLFDIASVEEQKRNPCPIIKLLRKNAGFSELFEELKCCDPSFKKVAMHVLKEFPEETCESLSNAIFFTAISFKLRKDEVSIAERDQLMVDWSRKFHASVSKKKSHIKSKVSFKEKMNIALHIYNLIR